MQNNWIKLSHRSCPVNSDGSESVTWQCMGGTMTITWGAAGCPFDPAAFQGPPVTQIGPLFLRQPPPPAGSGFDYTITITPRNLPTTVVKIDPQIEVDDGYNPLRKRTARPRAAGKAKKR